MATDLSTRPGKSKSAAPIPYRLTRIPDPADVALFLVEEAPYEGARSTRPVDIARAMDVRVRYRRQAARAPEAARALARAAGRHYAFAVDGPWVRTFTETMLAHRGPTARERQLHAWAAESLPSYPMSIDREAARRWFRAFDWWRCLDGDRYVREEPDLTFARGVTRRDEYVGVIEAAERVSVVTVRLERGARRISYGIGVVPLAPRALNGH